MCGIAGIFNLRDAPAPTAEELAAMAVQLEHRGPDGIGGLLRPRVGLAHTRLSIIDLAGGHQPIFNEDRTVAVVFNGEIFNYIELRAELEQKGHRFYTKSDTECLVHLYEEMGERFVERLNGQFAIALWDEDKQQLLLVRDRVGILPLFYKAEGNRLLFGSEIKAILPVAEPPERLDPASLDEVFTFWMPEPPNTVFPGVLQLLPGQMLILKPGEMKVRRYWQWSYPENDDQVETPTGSALTGQADELRHLLIDATRIRLRSDVPVGAYLSGGLDSSVLTALIKNYGDVPLRTFSIRFEDRSLDESEYQQELVKHLGADHSHIVCRGSDIASAFARTIWHTEAPVLRTAPVPMMLLSGLVRQSGFKVVLTGEGSDEVLGGYDIFKEAKIRQFWARNRTSKMRPRLLAQLYPYMDVSPTRAQAYLEAFFGIGLDQPNDPCFSHLPRWSTAAKCKEFFSQTQSQASQESAIDRLRQALPKEMAKWSPFRRSQYLEATSLLSGYLLSSQGDRMLMASSVEGRFPFLDPRVIEFAGRLHPTVLMRGLNEKFLLKEATRAELPKRIVKRKKQPYRAPDIPAFFQGSFAESARQLVSAEAIQKYGYFDSAKVARLLAKIERSLAPTQDSTKPVLGQKDNMAFVGILSTQLLHKQFIEEFGMHFRVPAPANVVSQIRGAQPNRQDAGM